MLLMATKRVLPANVAKKPPLSNVAAQSKTTANAAKGALANKAAQKVKAVKATNLNASVSKKQTPLIATPAARARGIRARP